MMNNGPKAPSKHGEFREDPNWGDPKPAGMVHDNNRAPHHMPQMKGKIFQQLQEVYNNPVRSTHGVVYDDGISGHNGPFAY